jgi:hypothetical protein
MLVATKAFPEVEDVWKIYEDFLKKGWGDGLPIIPPSRDRVNKMLEFTDRKADDVIGEVPPLGGVATVEKVAANAVMAGCKPEYFPVVLKALECALAPEVDLGPMLNSTGSQWPIVIANGPVAEEIGVNSSWGLMGTGPAFRANVTIGRALSLCLTNIGGSLPGITEMKPTGAIFRHGLCIAENEKANPWQPFHVEKGFDKSVSTVTLMVHMGDITFLPTHNPPGSETSQKTILEFIAKLTVEHVKFGMAFLMWCTPNPQYHIMYVLNPWHAWSLHEEGWTKKDVKRFIWEHSRWSLHEAPYMIMEDKARRNFMLDSAPKWARLDNLPPTPSPDDILIFVAGAEAEFYSEFLSSVSNPVTKPLTLSDGTPVKSIYDFKKAN